MTAHTRELKPCPFCGDEANVQRYEPHSHPISGLPDYPGAWSVECDACELRIYSHESREAVVAAWNQRSTEQNQEAALQRAREYLRELATKRVRDMAEVRAFAADGLAEIKAALAQPEEAEKAKGEPSEAMCQTMGRPRKECGCPDCGSSLIDFPSPD